MSERQRLYLIDGSSYIFRAYYAIRHLTNSSGMSTNAVFGFTNMLLKVVRDEQPDLLAVIFDSKEPSFRKKLYPEYKANRAETPPDLIPQFPYIRRVVDGFNVPSLELAGYEADDIIATVAKQFANDGYEVVIVTGDKDLMQVVSEHICLLDTMKNQRFGPAEVAERFGSPEQVIEVQGLAGDSSDNVPGVPGIGEKTARQLIADYGSIDNLLEHLDQIKQPKRRENLEQYADQARLSKELVTLVDNLDLRLSPDDCRISEPDREKLTGLFNELEFHKLLQEFSESKGAEPGQYQSVLDSGELERLVKKLEAVDEICFDTETTGLDPLQADLVGLSFATEPETGCYIPLTHHYLGAPSQLAQDQVLTALKPLLENKKIGKIAQNAKYDLLVMRRAGINVAGLSFDPMVASYLARPAAKSHGMDALANDLLGYRTISYEEVCGKGKNQTCFSEVEVERATVYAAEDADITLRLARELEPMLESSEQVALFRDIELPLVEVLAEMEWQGIRLDTGMLGSLSKTMAEQIKQLETEIYELAGGPFNVASPKQLGEVLFERLQLPRSKKTKTGWSTDVEVLKKLAEECDIAARLLDYRTLSKLKSTYTDALPKLVNPETGRIHTSFNQTVTVTGRLSSSHPNLQNIPIRTEEGRRIRKAFIPDEGNLLLSADYSQVELRLLAHLADESTLKQSFAAGEDIHRRTASEVFEVFPEMVTDEQRRQAKAINFGVIYGMSAFGLDRQLGIGRARAKEYIDRYFEHYGNIRQFMDRCIEEAKENKFATTLLGRRCAIPEIDSRNGGLRGNAERNAINYPVQGSAADLIKVAMIRIHARLRRENLASRMVLQVHDELVFDVPEKELGVMTELVRSEMEGAMQLSVPLQVDIGHGVNWSDAH
ncbi:MAG: DNA polymerase I [Desulfuromonas sp.]|nr:MAG: DNA polymerase I [Desulfuromonas sp.]